MENYQLTRHGNVQYYGTTFLSHSARSTTRQALTYAYTEIATTEGRLLLSHLTAATNSLASIKAAMILKFLFHVILVCARNSGGQTNSSNEETSNSGGCSNENASCSNKKERKRRGRIRIRHDQAQICMGENVDACIERDGHQKIRCQNLNVTGKLFNAELESRNAELDSRNAELESRITIVETTNAEQAVKIDNQSKVNAELTKQIENQGNLISSLYGLIKNINTTLFDLLQSGTSTSTSTSSSTSSSASTSTSSSTSTSTSSSTSSTTTTGLVVFFHGVNSGKTIICRLNSKINFLSCRS